MKIRCRRWRDNEARLKEAKHVSLLHRIGCDLKSSLAEVMAADLICMAQRKGFVRRFFDVCSDEDLQRFGITRT